MSPKIHLIYKVLILSIIITPLFSQTSSQLFQQALLIENGEGDLNSAIGMYTKIAEDQTADRSLRAKALLHVGMCYEKLGKEEALKAYQRLIKDFPGQKSEVAAAQERLAGLKPVTPKKTKNLQKPKFTKIKIPTKLRGSIKLSPDGKDLALVSDRKLWRMPLSGNLGPDFPGTPVQINTEDIKAEWSGLCWSGDGKWIAFNEIYLKEKQGDQAIYIVPSHGGKPKKITENFRDVRVINYRISLSPDGKNLAFSTVKDNEQHIYTISVDGGESKQLVDMQAREPVFSPDGRLIAFAEDKDIGKYEGEQGIWSVPAQGGTPILIADASKASNPVWSPDGKMIAFLDYSHDKEINIISVSKDGKATGELTVINVPAEIGNPNLLAGWTPENKIGVKVTSKGERALYTLPSEGGQAAIILNDCFALQPRWSPDGKEIFYTTLPAEGNNKGWRMTLASVSSGGGNGKYLPLDSHTKRLKPFGMQAGNRISPDGKTIISAAWCTDDTLANINWPGSHIWKISTDGLEQTKLTYIDGPYVDLSPSWSPNGKEVAFVRYHLLENKMDKFGESSILTINSDGSDPKILITESEKSISSPVWSPDGKMIAYLTSENKDPKTKTLNIINISNGNTRMIGEVPAAHFNIELAWSPDSKKIAFNDKEDQVIKVISLIDGSTEDIKTGLLNVSIYHLDWSPDGKRFVFGGWKGGEPGFWFLENFLPEN
jgi:Tol biopolymer transport system component